MTITNLYAALVEAQKAVRPVEKDAKNGFHNYKYASAESLIGEARDALTKSGLIAFALRWTFAPSKVITTADGVIVTEPVIEKGRAIVIEGAGVAMVPMFEPARVSVDYRIAHTSGEILDLGPVSTAVIPEKGRPEDKAEATALTYNLGYFLRGLLLIPRVDESEDADRRDDREAGGRPRAPVVDEKASTEIAAQLEAAMKSAANEPELLEVGKLAKKHLTDARLQQAHYEKLGKLFTELRKKMQAATPAPAPVTS